MFAAWLGGVLVAVCASLVSASAAAYCVMHTCEDVTEEQAEQDEALKAHKCATEAGCISEGEPLFWPQKCLAFGVSGLDTGKVGLQPEEFEAIVEEAFAVWKSVECPGGGNPGFEVSSVGVVESNGNFFCRREFDANLSVWSLVKRWTRQEQAMGYTSSMYNPRTGQIFDADVELHLDKFLSDIAPENYALVLGKVAVHEAGHYLGLAHSPNRESAMDERYNALELVSQQLAEDDIEGICDLYPPEGELECSPPGYVEAALEADACDAVVVSEPEASACSLTPGRHRPASAWCVGLALGGAWAWRRRRRDAAREQAVPFHRN